MLHLRRMTGLGVWLAADGGVDAVQGLAMGAGVVDSTTVWGAPAVIASLVRVALGIVSFAFSRRMAAAWASLRFAGHESAVTNGPTP